METYHPLRIYLFGSKVRGDDNEDSDYDFMVVVPDDMPQEKSDSKWAYIALCGTGVAADIVTWQITDFLGRQKVVASLPATVAREGILLYSEKSNQQTNRISELVTP